MKPAASVTYNCVTSCRHDTLNMQLTYDNYSIHLVKATGIPHPKLAIFRILSFSWLDVVEMAFIEFAGIYNWESLGTYPGYKTRQKSS